MSTDIQKQETEVVPITADSLEALLSPQGAGFDDRLPERESITEPADFNDVALDDDSGFSLVALSSGESTAGSGSGPIHQVEVETGRPRSTTSILPLQSPKQISHKKSASTTTICSAHNLPFLVARLDIQEESRPNRGSVDGQHKLQEEFARLQKEREEIEENNVNGAIDWGTSNFHSASMFIYQ